jgi:hypothetical protein
MLPEKQQAKKCKQLLAPQKQNVSVYYGPSKTNFIPKEYIQETLHDSDRHYIKHTHLHRWYFFSWEVFNS